MKKIIKIIYLTIACLIFAGCAHLTTMEAPPTGSTIAIVSELDNTISYADRGIKYAEFDYTSNLLDARNLLINPLKKQLEKAGYKVIVINVSKENPLREYSYTTRKLNERQKKYFHDLFLNKNISQAVLLRKESLDYETYQIPVMPEGYGYVSKAILLFGKNTNIYASISLTGINTDTYEIGSYRKVEFLEKTEKIYFSKNSLDVMPESLANMNTFFKEKLSPRLQQTLAVMFHLQ